MRYQGSKYRMRNILREVIESHLTADTTYVEPFAGGCNSLAYINAEKKIASDTNKYMIALWSEIKAGTFQFPETVSEEMYYDVKRCYLEGTGKYSDATIGYVATTCSYGGSWFAGYAHYNAKKHEDHVKEAKNGLLKQITNFINLESTTFRYCGYNELDIPENSFIYCDPPYAETKKYTNDFDNHAFYQWCRDMINQGHIILISEYSAPHDFIMIWEKEMQDGMGSVNKKKTEKLFVHQSQAHLFKQYTKQVA